LLNRAIVATRSHRPQLMEPAFDAIVEWLPDQATRFFAESMGQMDIIGSPDQVRAVMQDYYLRYSGDRTLH
jgi:alkanesulfonate monooxygenase SsuD/methylene tetrahydromethanopterin reductase-like flavin-dependent oxidoreductase (luciferase family)